MSGILPLEYTVIARATLYWYRKDVLKLRECSSLLELNFNLNLFESSVEPENIYTHYNILQQIRALIGTGEPSTQGWRICTDGSKSEAGVGCAYTV